MKLVWCACGKLVTYAGEDRCEDCWANDQARYRCGRSQAAHTMTTQGGKSREGRDDVPSVAKSVYPR